MRGHCRVWWEWKYVNYFLCFSYLPDLNGIFMCEVSDSASSKFQMRKYILEKCFSADSIKEHWGCYGSFWLQNTSLTVCWFFLSYIRYKHLSVRCRSLKVKVFFLKFLILWLHMHFSFNNKNNTEVSASICATLYFGYIVTHLCISVDF